MTLLTYPMQDNFETKLSQARDGATGTVYVQTAPSFTMPASSFTVVTVDPWTDKEQAFIMDSFNTSAKTLNCYSITVDKWPSLAYSQQSHSVGAKVIISNNYRNWKKVKDEIDAKASTSTTNTFTLAQTFSADIIANDDIVTSKWVIATAYASTAARDAALWGDWVATQNYTNIKAGAAYYNYNLSTNQREIQSTWTTPPDMTESAAGIGEYTTDAEAIGWVDNNWSNALVPKPSDIHNVWAYFWQNNTLYNLTIVPSRAAWAETIALKTKAWTDPSATDPIYIGFRNVTAGTGDWTYLAITAAESVVIPSTATMWATSAVPFRLRLVGINDWWTFRLGIVNTQTTTGMALDDDLLLSSTTIDTSSDSAWVIYSDSGVTTKAIRLLGYLDYTLATAGTRDTAPSKIQLFWPWVKKPWDTVQYVLSTSTAVATGTTAIPYDNTIPQNTEGDEYITWSITPTSTINKLVIDTSCNISHSASTVLQAALFQDSTANALASRAGGKGATTVEDFRLFHIMRAATTSSTTFKIRAWWVWGGTTTFNGTSWWQLYNWTLNSFIKITEIMV